MPGKILFLVPYPLHCAPSQRFRFEQYFALLEKNDFKVTVQSFLNSRNWKVFFIPGQPIGKAAALFKGFIKRLAILPTLNRYDYVFLHREAAPVGPPVLEWIIAKIFRCKIIFDFDDAIWITDRSAETALAGLLKWRSKIQLICRWSHKVSCGNEYLRAFALQHNANAIYNPTTLDTTGKHVPLKRPVNKPTITIGWTGTHSTLKYFTEVTPYLKQLASIHSHIKFVIIADVSPPRTLPNLEFIEWNEETEIVDLNELDIGIMPLPDNEWSRGKCGFKALQYMALEIPVVASAVGANNSIIDHGVDGLLVASPDDWIIFLDTLINSKEMRDRIGQNGRRKVLERFSVESNAVNFLKLFS